MQTSKVENHSSTSGNNLEFCVKQTSTRMESVGVLHPLSWQSIIPRWHFAMLNDVDRNHAFETAIKYVVHPNSTVLDIGAGSGLLAMMAARHGASYVTSCEMIQPIAHIAQKIIAINGFQDQIKIVPKKSDELIVGLDLPKRADLLITETVDCGLVGEGILPIIRHARQEEGLLRPQLSEESDACPSCGR